MVAARWIEMHWSFWNGLETPFLDTAVLTLILLHGRMVEELFINSIRLWIIFTIKINSGWLLIHPVVVRIIWPLILLGMSLSWSCVPIHVSQFMCPNSCFMCPKSYFICISNTSISRLLLRPFVAKTDRPEGLDPPMIIELKKSTELRLLGPLLAKDMGLLLNHLAFSVTKVKDIGSKFMILFDNDDSIHYQYNVCFKQYYRQGLLPILVEDFFHSSDTKSRMLDTSDEAELKRRLTGWFYYHFFTLFFYYDYHFHLLLLFIFYHHFFIMFIIFSPLSVQLRKVSFLWDSLPIWWVIPRTLREYSYQHDRVVEEVWAASWS